MIRRFLVSRAPFGVLKVPSCIPKSNPSIFQSRWYSAGPQLNKEIITERILELLEDYGNVKHPEKISAKASFSKDLGLDSLDTVELLMEVENEFSILIPDHEADELNTVSQTIDYISSQPDAC